MTWFEYIDPYNWFDPAAALPRAWRVPVTWVLLTVLIMYVIPGSFLSFARLHQWLTDGYRYVQIVVGILTLGLILVGVPSPAPSLPREPGGIAFVLLIFVLAAYWLVSTQQGGVGQPHWYQTIAFDPTVSTQWSLCISALILIGVRGGTGSVAANPLLWVATYMMILAACVLMVADTDFQHEFRPTVVTGDLWIRWRILNAGLLVPYLLIGVHVANGMRMRVVCFLGAITLVSLLTFFLATGRKP